MKLMMTMSTLSRRKLIQPSKSLSNFTKHAFAILDMVDTIIPKYEDLSIRNAGSYVLNILIGALNLLPKLLLTYSTTINKKWTLML